MSYRPLIFDRKVQMYLMDYSNQRLSFIGENEYSLEIETNFHQSIRVLAFFYSGILSRLSLCRNPVIVSFPGVSTTSKTRRIEKLKVIVRRQVESKATFELV
jgi:cytochrome c biogenesis protein CcdA